MLISPCLMFSGKAEQAMRFYLKLGEKTPIFKECYGLSPMSKWGMNRLWARDGTSPS